MKSPAKPPIIVKIKVARNHQPNGFQPFVLSQLKKTKNLSALQQAFQKEHIRKVYVSSKS